MFRTIKITGIMLMILGVAFATSRVSFSRPGNMMNIPSGTNYIDTDSFVMGASTDIYNFTIFNQSSTVNFNTYLTHNINVGLTIGTLADPSNDLMSSNFENPFELGLHYQHRVYSYKDISVSLGLQDLIFNSISGFDANSMSIFAVFSSELKFKQYILESSIGAGTGKLAANNFFYDKTIFGRQYLWNLFSHNSDIDSETGYNKEELKMINETRKIFNDDSIDISVTCIRVPVLRAHCESVNITLSNPMEENELREILLNAPGIKILDDRKNNQ